MKIRTILLTVTTALLLILPLAAQVPNLLNYQGRVAVGTPAVNFDGAGQFKFALVNADGSTTYWSNDGTSTAGSEPTAAVGLTVTKGLYSVLLGDTALVNMTALPSSVFGNTDVRLRVWFNDGTNGFQQLAPDQRLAAVGYAVIAGTVPDGAVTSAKLADGTVTGSKIVAGAVGSAQLASGAVQSANIAHGAIGGSQLADGGVANAKLENASITITPGAGLNGGGSVALGGSIVLTNAGVTSLDGGGGIVVSANTGAILLGSNATSVNSPGTLVLRDANGNFSAGTVTANLNGLATNALLAFDSSKLGGLTASVFALKTDTAPDSIRLGGLDAIQYARQSDLFVAIEGLGTSTNSANQLVKRDGNGDFAARIISATTFVGSGTALSNLNGANLTASSITSDKLAPDAGFPAGGIISFAGATAPPGWLLCNGAAVSRSTYAALFAAIGITHGSGNGSTTFNLPDYRGRFLRGADGGTGRDPDAATRTAMAPGGSIGNAVGTVQNQATRRNGLAINDGGHSHAQYVTGNSGGSGIRSDYNYDGAGQQIYSQGVNTGISTSGVSLTTGDAETRPINVSVSLLIKY